MRSCICRHNGVKILGGKKSVNLWCKSANLQSLCQSLKLEAQTCDFQSNDQFQFNFVVD
ncbi:hypothetical protein T03_1999 [Trichinella britovi]|uniref:Uncharacterized protein n=1 Tax=Trichinella britovi TaxID=45882 RepID=A0A0V0YV58_TRIBR|nr:hypothetical protein T03_1999 [Trichinella britovi]